MKSLFEMTVCAKSQGTKGQKSVQSRRLGVDFVLSPKYKSLKCTKLGDMPKIQMHTLCPDLLSFDRFRISHFCKLKEGGALKMKSHSVTTLFCKGQSKFTSD